MSALRICALIAVVLDLQLVAAGKVGCRYDDLLCGSAEVCVDGKQHQLLRNQFKFLKIFGT